MHQPGPCFVPSLTKACGSSLQLTRGFQARAPAQQAQQVVGWLDQLRPRQHDLADQAKDLGLNLKKRTKRCWSSTSHCYHPTLRSAPNITQDPRRIGVEGGKFIVEVEPLNSTIPTKATKVDSPPVAPHKAMGTA